MTDVKSRTIVLCIGGHDPTGGAGLQADIETVSALGGRAVTAVTALTSQDTHDIHHVVPVDADQLRQRLTALVADIAPDVVKIGLLADAALLQPLCALLDHHPGAVVLDPVLAAGGGFDVGGVGLISAIREHLIPRSALVTPNHAEATRLAGCDDPDAAAAALLGLGAGAVLLTGADVAEDATVSNRLYTADAPAESFDWPLLPHRYHGSGCTLASACATRLGLGDSIRDAVASAQAFTWKALSSATADGTGQWLPRRLP